MKRLLAFLWLLWKTAVHDPEFGLPDRGGILRFTGWKGSQNNDGLVAQWLYYPQKKTDPILYVTIPSMVFGETSRGGCMEVGSESLTLGHPNFLFRNATASGLWMLLDKVAEKYPNVPVSVGVRGRQAQNRA